MLFADDESEWDEYQLGPTMCFGGKVDDITNFWDKNVKDSFSKQVNYDMSITEPQYCPMVRNDWEQLLPCCGSDQYYEDSSMGISLNK